MKKILALAIALVVASMAYGQSDTKRIIRIRLQHADPWYIMAMLSGKFDPYLHPEQSTIYWSMSSSFSFSNQGTSNGSQRGFGCGQ